MSRPGTDDQTLIGGRNPVREALERGEGNIEKILIQQGAGGAPIRAIRRAATRAGVPVQVVPAARLARLAPGLHHQGVLAVAAPVRYHDVDAMLTAIAPDLDAVRQHKPIVLVLDQVEDPHNFGALLRTAVAAGVAGVIVPARHMAPLGATALKASAGTATRIPVARTTNLGQTLYALKERGYWVVGTTGAGTTPVWEMDWDRPVAVVMGSEDRGLRPHIADHCDYLVAIPLRGPAESLNVSVAAGIVLFAAARVRG